jgi:hypothetical protein
MALVSGIPLLAARLPPGTKSQAHPPHRQTTPQHARHRPRTPADPPAMLTLDRCRLGFRTANNECGLCSPRVSEKLTEKKTHKAEKTVEKNRNTFARPLFHMASGGGGGGGGGGPEKPPTPPVCRPGNNQHDDLG